MESELFHELRKTISVERRSNGSAVKRILHIDIASIGQLSDLCKAYSVRAMCGILAELALEQYEAVYRESFPITRRGLRREIRHHIRGYCNADRFLLPFPILMAKWIGRIRDVREACGVVDVCVNTAGNGLEGLLYGYRIRK